MALWSCCAVWESQPMLWYWPLPFNFQSPDSSLLPWGHLTTAGYLFRILPRAPSLHLHSISDSHVAFCEGPESHLTLKMCSHQSSPSYVCHCSGMAHKAFPILSAFAHIIPVCCSHRCSYLLPLVSFQPLEDPAQCSPPGSLLV